MKKKIISLLLIMLLTFNLTGCMNILGDVFSQFSIPDEFIENNKEEEEVPEYENEKDYLSYTYYDLGREDYYNWHYFPSTGNQKLLVIPVTIEGYTSNATDTNITRLEKAFFGSSDDELLLYESLSSYYFKSSYGKLNINGVVLPWTSKVYDARNIEEFTSELLSDTTTYLLNNGIKLSDYDSDSDGYLDGVYYIYSSPVGDKARGGVDSSFWAYTANDPNSVPSISEPKVNCYALCSIDFSKSSSNKIDAHAYIHEFGHMLGLDDYYNATELDEYETKGDAVGYTTMMSYNIGDLDCYSKYALGWITPTVITNDTNEMTITLKSIEDVGSAIIITDSNKGVFSEYYMLEYYTPTSLNEMDSLNEYVGYYDSRLNAVKGYNSTGVRVYTVDARVAVYDKNENLSVLSSLDDFDSSIYDMGLVAHSNTVEYSAYYDYDKEIVTDKFECKKELLELIDKSKRDYHKVDFTQDNRSFFKTGDTLDLSKLTLNSGLTLNFTITFGEENNGEITITITKNNI